jgi:poly(A) polymerase
MKHMPVKPKKLLTGRDVMAILGIPPGKKLGEILEKLDELQLSGEIKTEDEARNWLKKL